ncbi:MAG: TrmH family RNA methyltransferase [Anaerolineales bacterium]
MITSLHNPRVQWIKALQKQPQRRQEEGVLVIEGVRLAEEAMQAGLELQLAWFLQDLDSRGQRLVEQLRLRDAPLEEVSPAVMKAVSDTETPQGLLLVVKQPHLPIPSSLGLVFLPDQIRDPGNLGTMLRTAAAAGVELVLLPPGSVDVTSPKVVRSAMGAHFTVPMRQMTWQDIETLARNQALQVFLADVNQGIPYTQADFRTPLMLIIGSEASGASSSARALANQSIFIPMPGKAESLNAAVAAGVLLFEIIRQRGNPR